MLEIGNRVKITEVYFEDLLVEHVERHDLRSLVGTVIKVRGTEYHVKFDDAPYFKDYWIMYESELELVES